MAIPYIAGHLRHILLKLLPSPEIKFAAQQLRISNHLDMICESLWAINALILDANLRGLVQPKLRKWVQDVNAAIMDVQNILEVIQDFYKQPNEQKQEVTTSPSLLPHASSIRTGTFFISSSRHTILVDLKQIAQSLNCLLSRTVTFVLHLDMIDSIDPNQAEYLSILHQEVVGRDDDMNNILEIIFGLQKGQSLSYISDDEPFVVAITGKPKVGKSMLARMVYHHPLVREVFTRRIWVNVLNYESALSDHKQIARECAKHLSIKISSNVDIWDLIRQSLAQTRFLLILDGLGFIEEENKDKLEELMKNLFCLGAPGSRVIITCYKYPIVQNDPIVYSEKKYYIGRISKDLWTKIFLRYATPTTQHDQPKKTSSSTGMTDLENLTDKAYQEAEDYNPPCDAKGIGLISRHTRLSDDRNDYKRLIRAHYNSYASTQTLLYWNLFGSFRSSFANSYFDMLIAEDICTYSRNYEEIIQGKRHRSMFNFWLQAVGSYCVDVNQYIYNFSRKYQEFRIPQQCRYLCICIDLDTSTILNNLPIRIANHLRMLLLYKAKEDMDLIHQEASSIEIPESMVKNLIILSIMDIGIRQLPNRLSKLLRLRYLNISEKDMEELPESIYDLYNLRVLSLSHCEKLLKLPEKIHNLAKLQILRLSYCTRLQMLPKSISNLVNLQVLDIEACHWLKELPKDLRYLERLRSLNMIGCASLTTIPLGISELTDLQRLSGYTINDYDSISLTIKELESLTDIEELHIRHLEFVLNVNDIISVNLKEKKYLENLVLHWEWWNMDERAHDQKQSLKVLDSFQPNVSHLKSLEIISYLGMQFPNWMMMDMQLFLFKYLVKIRLINLKRCENLPSLGILPSLYILEVSGLDSLTYVGNIISNEEVIFSNLNELTLSMMPNLVEWNVRCPQLYQLTLIHCPKLKRLSGFVLRNSGSPLRSKLTIWLQSKMLEQYSTWFQSIFRDIEELEIVGCHELRWLPEDIKNCNNLTKLSIIRCGKILSLPDWLLKMPNLEEVLVSGCTSISHVPDEPEDELLSLEQELKQLEDEILSLRQQLEDELLSLEQQLEDESLSKDVPSYKQKLKVHIIIEGCPKLQALTR